MRGARSHQPAVPASSAVELLDGVPLPPEEAAYVEAARAANTLRGYRSDWLEFTAWCAGQGGLDRSQRQHRRSNPRARHLFRPERFGS